MASPPLLKGDDGESCEEKHDVNASFPSRQKALDVGNKNENEYIIFEETLTNIHYKKWLVQSSKR